MAQDSLKGQSKAARLAAAAAANQQQLQVAHQQTVKTARKKVTRLDDSEEGRARRQMLFDILFMLVSFHNDRDRLHAVVAALHALKESTPTLTFIEKTSGNDLALNRTDQLMLLLLDVGFDIAFSDPETFLTRTKLMSAITSDLKLGQMPRKENIARLMTVHRLQHLDLSDTMALLRQLFAYHQWERFSLLARMVDALLTSDVMDEKFNEAERNGAGKEVVVRLAAVNFWNVVLSERKVGFDAKPTGKLSSRTQTPANVVTEPPPASMEDNIDISLHMHAAAVGFLDAIADCMDDPLLPATSPRLLVDACRLMWRVLEPIFRPFTALGPVPELNSGEGRLSLDTLVVILFRSLHAVLIDVGQPKDAPFVLEVAEKLSIVLEGMHEYDLARGVLEEVIEKIQDARVGLGEGARGFSSITCQLGFHREMSEKEFNILSDFVEDTPGDNDSSSSMGNTCRDLASALVRLYRAFFRNRLKHQRAVADATHKALAMTHLRLTNKHLFPVRQRTLPAEEELRACAGNMTIKALLLMAYTREGSNLDEQEKADLLHQSAQLLRASKREERTLLRSQVPGTLLHKNQTAKNPEKLTTAYPPPLFVRRTRTTITVRIAPLSETFAGNSSGLHQEPAYYQIYCRDVTHMVPPHSVSASDGYFPGTAAPIGVDTDCTITNLNVNHAYVLAVAGYDAKGNLIRMGRPTDPIIATFPLPLVLCWGNLAQISHDANCKAVANEAFATLRSYLVVWDADDERLRRPESSEDTFSEAMFRLNEPEVISITRTAVQSFIEAVYALVERTFSTTLATVTSDSEGTRDIRSAQMLRLNTARNFHVALELARLIKDDKLMLVSSFKIFEIIIPLLRLEDVNDPEHLPLIPTGPTPLPFLVQLLLACHSTFVSCSGILGDNRGQGVRDHYCYVVFHLARRLMSRKRHFDVLKAMRVIEEAVGVLNSVPGAPDVRVWSSQHLENEWVGTNAKGRKSGGTGGPKEVGGKKKNKGGGGSDFAYHSVIAVSNEVGKGYEYMARRLETFCEYLEVELIRANNALVALHGSSGSSIMQSANQIPAPQAQMQMQPLQRVGSQPLLLDGPVVASSGNPMLIANSSILAPTALNLRKVLDQSATTLKELASVLTASGPDIALENLHRFRKNPRFVELAAFATVWCIQTGIPDHCIRICVDVEEWIEKRNLKILTYDDEEVKEGGGTIGKRKKRSLFGEKKTQDKKRTKERGRLRHASNASVAGPRPKSGAVTKSRKSKYGSVIDAVTGENATGGQHSEPKLDGSGRTDVNPISEISRRAQSDVIHPGEVPGTPPPTAFGIQLSKPTVSDSQPSPRPIHRERSQSPGSHHARSDAGGDTSTSVDAVTLRRKRAAARQAYFANLTPQDRENKERAIRVLDTVLSAFWKRRRYARRLRIVLDFEAPARARLALAHGLAVFEQLQKEVSGRDMGTSIDQTLRDQLEFRASGKIILNEFRTDPPRRVTVTTNTGSTALAVGTANADDLSPRGVTPDITRMILDMSQYMVQSITLAVRIKAWSQVLESCQHLWTAHRFLLSRNVLNGTEFRRQTLWRAWWIAATCLLDLLDGVSVRSADDEENHAHFGIPSRPSTGQTFGYPSRPATASKDAFHHQRLPLKSLSDLYTQQFIAGWLDRFGEIQVTPLDLSKIAAMCLFSLETLAAAKRNHRMIEFGMRFDRTFCGVYGQILRPVLGDAYDEYCRGTAEEGQWMTEAETWFDQGKEPRTPLQLLVRARSYHAECTLQTIRTKEPLSVPSKFLMAATGAYEAALEAAHAQKARNTAAMAAHEFGNLLFANGDREGACHLWSKCIDFVMDKTRVITDWKSVIGGDTWQFSTSASASKDVLQITGGIKNAVVAGMAIIKIVRNWYEPLHLDKHHSLVLFAAKLFSAPLKGSIPHPSRPASYGLYTPPYLSPLMDIFSDPLRCDPGTFSDALVYTASELITVIGEPWVAVPLLSLVEHLAISVYKSSSLLALARILKADGLVAMDSLADGIECLLSVSLGKALIPEDKKHYAAPAGTAVLPLADTRYDEKTHLLDSMLNLRLLRNVAEHVLSDKLGVLYGAEVAQKYELVRCKIVLRILNLSGATNADVGNVKYEQLVSRQKEDALDRNLSEKGNPLSVGLQSPHLSELPHSHNYPAAGSFAIDPNNRNASISSATGLAIAVPNHGSVSTLNKSMKRDAPGLLNAILPRLDAVLGKLISDAQIDIRNTPLSNKETWDSRVEMIVRGFDCAAQVHMLRWNYEAASKCLTSALLVLETRESSPMKPSYSIRPAIVSRFSSMPPRAYLHLQILSRLVESLLSHGLFGVAKEYAAKGISLGRANNTTKFLAYFMAMESVAVRHGRQTNAGWSDKQDEDEMPRSTNAKWLSEIDKILTVAGSKGIRTPQEWHILGDLYSVHHWPSFSSAIAAYTHACDAWKRTVPCTGRADGKSSYNGAINGFVQSSACLAWAMWDSGSHSPGAVASVLSQARNAACQIVHANPSTILQLSVLTATVTAAQRHAIDRHNAAYRSTWKAARRYFSDALHAIISDGYEHATLSSVLGGLATLYAGLTAESNSLLEPEGQAEEESKTFLHPGAGTTAALAYQATRCEGMRRALLEGTELDTSVKLKTQDVGLLAAKEIHQFLQMRTGEVDTSSLLAPEDILKPQGGFGLLSPNAQLMNLSGYKWHAQEWMDFLCSLTQDRAQRPAITTTSFSDPWQAAVAARIRRVHALLSEHVGVPYTMESCLTDSCIPKPEATADGALSLIGSPCLPDDAWSLSWTTQKPTSVHYEGCDGNTKTVERDYVYGILVQINIPRASTSTTPTTSSSRPSRPPTQSQPAGKTAKKISPRSSVASRGSSRHGNGTAASNSSLGTASSGSSIALVPASPQLMCFVFRVPLSTLKSMRDIGSKIMAILDLGDADDFEAEIEEVWSSLIGCVKACFGVNGEVCHRFPIFEITNALLTYHVQMAG
ncbi:hypothetical protein DFS34DRAFT_623406 [Phlyctochytrium arcticum]|nr:hypothetical protein DFS34DRAFT_623406 [Phlyctochytrium arcticum]